MTALVEDDDSYDQEFENLTSKEKKEIEKRRERNRKKNESKKKNKKASQKKVNNNISNETEMAVDEPVKEVIKEENQDISDVKLEENGEKEDMKMVFEINVKDLGLAEDSDEYNYFKSVFEKFTYDPSKADISHNQYSNDNDMYSDQESKAEKSEQILQEEIKSRKLELQEVNSIHGMSRKQLKKALQPSIVALKQCTSRPDVVEWADTTSRDPFLLVTLKSYRNTVPIPPHWNAKRKYLAGKRGFERPPFELPECIKKTGIMEMRETMWEKESSQSLRSKMKERVRPKLGRINIDYQDLHDAFFKWQTKPHMTKMGDLYYEGKEMDAKMYDKKPGKLSDELRLALGMPIGQQAYKFPPPWLIAMQRYGPPPSYPNLKIPGLNSPIPDGCMFGYHPGGWGKPPVDEFGKTIYGDVFGIETPLITETVEDRNIDRRHWGEIEQDYVDEDDEVQEENDDDDAMDIAENENIIIGSDTSGIETPSGISSVVTGYEIPQTIELRKPGINAS
ncbi:Splicing factor 3B subunit 2 [Strongyloides ratti]|uniref:Splicing factor 3B subunit 2 n=1 Tax=Strongyloides ratti TaxID=34506 RepID=A0A090L1F5_STRRB|nr:Splicing factor 3B subunit 2 [Strongyloides ratti]CEF63531.1 Splicing factor 3B subunit 2 [Strongyloides ratti]